MSPAKPPDRAPEKDYLKLSRDASYIYTGLRLQVADEISRTLQRTGMTQAQLGRKLGVSRQAVRRLYDGTGNVTLATLAKIAVALGCRWELKLTSEKGASPDEPESSDDE